MLPWDASQFRSESVLALWKMNASCASPVSATHLATEIHSGDVFVTGQTNLKGENLVSQNALTVVWIIKIHG